MKKPLVIANWKMYVQTPDAAKKFAASLKRRAKSLGGAEAWIAPPYTLLSALPKGPYKLGGQAASPYEGGAHTGEVSAAMLKAAGAHFCIVGHSEQRAAGADDVRVRDELMAVLKENLYAVLCVGEDERREDGWHFIHIEAQLRTALVGARAFADKLAVAYEPVWAIGKSAAHAMPPHDVEETAIFIKKVLADLLGRETALKVPILYGGSVEPDNAAALLGAGVNGFLVGHASANVDSFTDILKVCKR